LKNFFENHRGSGKFINHRVAAAARQDFFISRRGSGSSSAVMDISDAS
jgi:hypothetical protein